MVANDRSRARAARQIGVGKGNSCLENYHVITLTTVVSGDRVENRLAMSTARSRWSVDKNEAKEKLEREVPEQAPSLKNY